MILIIKMKINIYLSLALLFFIEGIALGNYKLSGESGYSTNDANSVCDYSWGPQISGTTSNLLSVSAVSNQIGWAAGDGATVRKTSNGGSAWSNGNSNPGIINGDIYNIYAWSANDALCTTSPTPTSTFIYKTTNGGTNWIQVYSQTNGFINAIQMISSSEGYAIGDPVSSKWTVLKTTDGGLSWARLSTEPNQIGSETGFNNSFFILGSNIWFGTGATKVYHSTDLGLNWSFGVTTGTVNSSAIHFNSLTSGLTGGTAMLISTNGGVNYSVTTSPGTSGFITGIEGDSLNWWAIRSDANIYRSTNSSVSWTNAYTQSGTVFNDIDFDLNTGCPIGWAVGNNGIIAKMSLITEVLNINSLVPSKFKLNQNFPNPFNPATNINFSIPKSGLVTLKIYDMNGSEVAVLVNEVKTAGNYLVGFNAADLPSGAYFYRLESDNISETRKMLLIK